VRRPESERPLLLLNIVRRFEKVLDSTKELRPKGEEEGRHHLHLDSTTAASPAQGVLLPCLWPAVARSASRSFGATFETV
jgi:hypothetical protein